MAALRKTTPSSLEELKITIESYAESLTRYKVLKCVINVRDRARACIQRSGGNFERQLNKLKNEAGDSK